MSSALILTTDLPFFPGKNGHDYFNLRHLAQTHYVGVVSPCYDSLPKDGVVNLEKSVQATYCWPRPVVPSPLFIHESSYGRLPSWVERIPHAWRLQLLRRLLGISGQPDDAYERLLILANCAPQLIRALNDRQWTAIILIQTSLAPWMNFLPRFGAKVVYFHDVRSDYLARADPSIVPGTVASVHRQEQIACDAADAVGFVSALDMKRAQNLLDLPGETVVAPIPIDTSYFVPRPDDWVKDPRQIVLFTGHLRHPPNVDAVLHFLANIWPLVLAEIPDAIFQAVGLTPDPRLQEAIAATRNAELRANVPDIRPYFWNADVYVVPMRYGGGVRQKIFEAWAMRLPVVCTPMGAEGIDARSGENCWLEHDPEEFAERVVQLLQQDNAKGLRDAAQIQVGRTNSIPAAAGAFTELIHRGVTARRKHSYKLLYDLRWMEIGKAGGAEQMTHELIQAISQIDRINSYRAYVPRSTYYEWESNPAFDCIPHFSDNDMRQHEHLQAALPNQLATSLRLPPVLTPEMRTLRRWHQMDFDLVHSMVGYMHPDLACFPSVVTALDLQHLHYPGFFTPEDWQTRDKLYRESAHKAQHIICISEHTRQDMHHYYQVPLDKMTTIWLIPSRHVWSPPADSIMRRLLVGMGVRDPFLYFPAHSWPHKNHAKLIEAFALILPYISKDMRLVFSGGPLPAAHPAHQLILQHGLEHRVKHLGYRSSLEVQALMHGCFALVFPSLFEGYGIPVMDAIIAGKPVVCSNCSSLPEIAGDAALTFDPNNIHDIGGRLLEVINDPARRATLIDAGRRRRPLFSAKLSAIKTLAVYRQVYENSYRF